MKKFWKVVGRIALILLALILAAVLVVLGIRAGVVLTASDHLTDQVEEIPDEEPYDAIIVLGASVLRSREPSKMLKNRLDAAIDAWKAGVSDKILVTGDHRPGEYDEVDVMWEYLVERNIPESKIVRDYKGFSTYDSMYRAATEFELHRAVVVTQQYHLPRAMLTGETYGLELYGLSSPDVGDWKVQFSRTVREWAATVKDFWYCLTRKEIEE